MGAARFWVVSFVVAVVFLVLTRWLFTNEYFFFAGYVVLQYIVLATAWNILGGYTGYTNFGVGAFLPSAPTARSCSISSPRCRCR